MTLEIETGQLQAFEAGLDPARPQAGGLAVEILGYGEMSTVFRFPTLTGQEHIAFKRMAVFNEPHEVENYCTLFFEYHRTLEEIGINTPPHNAAPVRRQGRPVLYLAQQQLPADSIGPAAVRKMNEQERTAFFDAILDAVRRWARHNAKDPAGAVGLDAQLSNWAWVNGKLVYLDTSTPLIRKGGREQLDPELFLRICPGMLRWVIRKFFLKDVLERYYDPRLILIDLMANLYKERLDHLIEELRVRVNHLLVDLPAEPVKVPEIQSYYREDKLIWRIFLFARRLERLISRLMGKPYDLILPGKIKR